MNGCRMGTGAGFSVGLFMLAGCIVVGMLEYMKACVCHVVIPLFTSLCLFFFFLVKTTTNNPILKRA